MVIPAASTDDRYATGDPYTDSSQYGSSGLTGSRYGDQYGSGTYSSYSTDRGFYSAAVEISRYSNRDGSGYGYTAADPDSSQETGMDYVVDVLNGKVEIAYDSAFCYT